MSHGYDMPGMNGWGYALITVNSLILWGLAVAVIVVLTRRGTWSHRDEMPHRDGMKTSTRAAPLDLLAERFARGEIDEDEYRHGCAVLRGTADRERNKEADRG